MKYTIFRINVIDHCEIIDNTCLQTSLGIVLNLAGRQISNYGTKNVAYVVRDSAKLEPLCLMTARMRAGIKCVRKRGRKKLLVKGALVGKVSDLHWNLSYFLCKNYNS